MPKHVYGKGMGLCSLQELDNTIINAAVVEGRGLACETGMAIVDLTKPYAQRGARVPKAYASG